MLDWEYIFEHEEESRFHPSFGNQVRKAETGPSHHSFVAVNLFGPEMGLLTFGVNSNYIHLQNRPKSPKLPMPTVHSKNIGRSHAGPFMLVVAGGTQWGWAEVSVFSEHWYLHIRSWNIDFSATIKWRYGMILVTRKSMDQTYWRLEMYGLIVPQMVGFVGCCYLIRDCKWPRIGDSLPESNGGNGKSLIKMVGFSWQSSINGSKNEGYPRMAIKETTQWTMR